VKSAIKAKLFNMQNYKQQFKGKKITIMGLGILGRGLGYTKFLAECGADLIVTDLKNKKDLATSIKVLSKYKNIKFVLGEHRLQDFKNRDMIIKNPGVPMDSIYISEARKNNIPIEMDVSLFAKCAPNVTIIGVTGTRGKSMTTMLIYEVLKANEKFLKHNVYLGGNIRGVATLPLLSKVKEGDIVVCELDSWQLQGFGEAQISPTVSVFTTFMRDHMNYYKDDMKKYFADKANIFKFQKKGDTLIILPKMKKMIPKNIKSTLIVADTLRVENLDFVVPGIHQRENLATAVEVAKILNIPESKIKLAVKNFRGVEGRLQYVKSVKGVNIYNDNNATTPEATIAGLEAFSSHIGKIILIAGGSDKSLDLKNLRQTIKKYCKAVVLLSGTGTDKLKDKNEITYNLKEAINQALKIAKKGDTILFSPAFASFGMFTNEYDRNDQFMKIINKLK
jgi:UDP-N-acetylmuramoylalanine--D-glutamate ligase